MQNDSAAALNERRLRLASNMRQHHVSRRTLVDVTTAARMGGPADGIVRVIRELARYGLGQQSTEFIVFDAEAGEFKIVKRRWVRDLIEGGLIIDLPAVGGNKRRTPRVLRWITHPRKKIFEVTEELRLSGGVLAKLAARIQSGALGRRYRRKYTMPDGGRITQISTQRASSGSLALRQGDVVVLCGSDWSAMRLFLEAQAVNKVATVVALCHDIIPLLYPQFFLKSTAQAFASCFDRLSRIADLVIFTTETVRKDALAYFAAQGVQLHATSVVSLGSTTYPPATSSRSLRSGLSAGRYALFVSTFEPRKGHAMLLSAWKKLLGYQDVRESSFKLVFVGRKGWLVDDLFARLDAEPAVGDSLLILSDVDDGELSQLYANAAFCVYPSIYEGFGLPIVESFRYGKAVICSSGGALPEVVGGRSPCLDPQDEDAWVALIRDWIAHPQARLLYESKIRDAPHRRTWRDMADDFFKAVDQFVGAPPTEGR